MKSAIGSLILLSAVSVCVAFDGSVLENASFETGDETGWAEAQPIGGTIGAPMVGAQSGSSALEVTIENGGAVPEARQILPASPGEVWEMRGFMLTEQVLPAGPSFGLFKIVFQDECGADLLVQDIEIGGQNFDFPGVESAPFLDAAQPAGTWVESIAKGTAPAGTVRVALLLLNVDFAGGENPIWFDTVQVYKDNGTTNELVNGDFDTGDTSGWTGVFSPPFVGEPSGAMPQDGSFALKLNGGGVSTVEQSFPIAPGDPVSLSGFLLTENTLLAGSFGLYKIVFRDADGIDLAPGTITMGQASDPANPGIDSLPFVDENSAPNTWIESEAAGIAPAGAVEVLFLALNVDFGGGSNPIWLDDVCATGPSSGGCPSGFERGDVNQDGAIDLLDVGPFVDALNGMTGQCEADVDGDGNVNLLDVGPFIALLSGG